MPHLSLNFRKNSIRLATPEDFKEILAIINTTNRLFYKGIIPPEKFKDPFMSEEELKEEFNRKDFYVFELGSRIVGVAAFETITTDLGIVGIITRVYVLPQFQRRGIGTALIAEIETAARGQGVKKMLIWTDPNASWAIAFYKKIGYQEVDPAVRYGSELIDARIEKHRKELLVLQKAL